MIFIFMDYVVHNKYVEILINYNLYKCNARNSQKQSINELVCFMPIANPMKHSIFIGKGIAF